MDPQRTWEMLLDAWVQRNWEDVVELTDALLSWIAKNGFPPEAESPRRLGVDVNLVITQTACQLMRQRARSVLDAPSGIPSDVPFTLTCCDCNNEGPDTHVEAVTEGWTDIEYVPNMTSETFLGVCPVCLANDG